MILTAKENQITATLLSKPLKAATGCLCAVTQHQEESLDRNDVLL